ncbi:MAG TPA: hypothetical protein VF384_13600 [Planctomycetota bacterium]
MTAGARTMGTVAAVLLAVVFVAYPLFVWIGLSQGSPRHVAAILLCVMVPVAWIRMRRSQRAAMRGLAAVPIATLLCLVLSAALDAEGYMLLVPVLINAIFLAVFGWSLRANAMPMVERFARLQEDDLPPEKQAWCRMWTILWSVFFVANGATALVLALLVVAEAAPRMWWATYNGLIAYVLMGIMFASEWTLRRRRFSRG